MKTTTQTRAWPARLAVILLVAYIPLLLLPAAALGADGDVQVAFKLDPRLTRGIYMGERWVTPSTYTQLQEGEQMTIAARSSSPAIWQPADAAMVTVSPSSGSEVTITVHQVGTTTLDVGGKTLAITAETVSEGTLKVQISQ